MRFPFDPRFVVQGLQYCIHPEIQANYLLLTNGERSAVYDAHASVFLGNDMYTPILAFTSKEVASRWKEIFDLLSAENVRTLVEGDLKAMYDKLSLTSLDKTYPQRLLKQIGVSSGDHSRVIERNVIRFYSEADDKQRKAWRSEVEQLTAKELFDLMELPLGVGMKSEGTYFVDKELAAGIKPLAIFHRLTDDYDRQSIFRKEQTFLAICFLHKRISALSVRQTIREFLEVHKDKELPALNQVECALLRMTRKNFIISVYPSLRAKIDIAMKTAPELVRFVRPPNSLQMTYAEELEMHYKNFQQLKAIPDDKLRKWIPILLKIEEQLEDAFKTASKQLRGDEHQIGGFEYYGTGGIHYAFKNIVTNSSLDNDIAP